MNLGKAYALDGKLPDAEHALRDALNTYPDSVELADQLAQILTEAGKKAEAEAVLRVVKERQAQAGTAEQKDH
jgi:TolA-binding protein